MPEVILLRSGPQHVVAAIARLAGHRLVGDLVEIVTGPVPLDAGPIVAVAVAAERCLPTAWRLAT